MSAPEKYKPVTVLQLDEALNGTRELTDASAPTEENLGASPEHLVVFQVSAGHPTDMDLAALVAVLNAVSNSAIETAQSHQGHQGPTELWGLPSSMHRQYTPFSPDSFLGRRH